MEDKSPLRAVREIETQIKLLLRGIEPETLNEDSRKVARELKQLVVDTRLDIRDYEYSDTRTERLENAVAAKSRIALVQANILAATDIFNAIDTAQITARLEQINEWLD